MADLEPLLHHYHRQQSERKRWWWKTFKFVASQKRSISIALGPLAALLILMFVDINPMEQRENKSMSATRMLAILSWVCIWWVTEAVPVAITSLVPLCLFPAMKLSRADEVAESYMNDTITIFIGSFILSLAVEKYNVHKRLALKMLLFFGGESMNPRLLLLGFCAGPAFASMWMSNTAAAVMMIPMSVGVLHKLESGHVAYIQRHSLCPTCGAEDLDRFESVDKGDILKELKSRNSSTTDLSVNEDQLKAIAVQQTPANSNDTGGSSLVNRPLEKKKSFFDRELTMQALLEEDEIAAEVAHIANFGRAVVMAIAYSVSIGGLSTLTGTSTNMILSGMWSKEFPTAAPVTYLQWFLFGFPLALILLTFCWALLCYRYCPLTGISAITHSLNRSSIQEEHDSLGSVTFAESAVLSLFMILAALWFTRALGTIGGWGQLFDGYAGDGTVSILVATFLFIIPNKVTPGETLMDWNTCKKLPWDIVLLLGAGFALAQGIRSSGLSDWVTQNMDFLQSASYYLIAPIVATFVGITTEFTSNNATATVFLPLLADVAMSIGVHPMFLMLTGTISASFAFMLPIGTPPNAIAFSTGYLKITDTVTTGLIIKVFGILLISVMMPTLGSIVFNLDKPFQL